MVPNLLFVSVLCVDGWSKRPYQSGGGGGTVSSIPYLGLTAETPQSPRGLTEVGVWGDGYQFISIHSGIHSPDGGGPLSHLREVWACLKLCRKKEKLSWGQVRCRETSGTSNGSRGTKTFFAPRYVRCQERARAKRFFGCSLK